MPVTTGFGNNTEPVAFTAVAMSLVMVPIVDLVLVIYNLVANVYRWL